MDHGKDNFNCERKCNDNNCCCGCVHFVCKKKVTVTSNSNTTVFPAYSGSAPIGIRNNNPLNLRVSANAWQGKVQSDNAFEKFSEMKYGVRAGIKNLQSYRTKYSLSTITEIISKWAPSNENDTKAYINYVASAMGVGAKDTLPYDAETYASLFEAMSAVELGKKYAIPKASVLAVIQEFKLF